MVFKQTSQAGRKKNENILLQRQTTHARLIARLLQHQSTSTAEHGKETGFKQQSKSIPQKINVIFFREADFSHNFFLPLEALGNYAAC